MSYKKPTKEESYFLRTQSSILKGEKFIPFSSLREKAKNKNKLSINKKKNKKKRTLTENKSIKHKKNIKDKNTGSYSSFRGINLNKVSGYFHSPKKLDIFSKTFQNKENKEMRNFKEKEIDEKENKMINDNNYINRYHQKLNLNYNENLNNNEFEKNTQIENKNHNYNENYYLNRNEDCNYIDIYNYRYNNKNNLNNKDNNNLKEEILSQNKGCNNINEQYLPSLPTNIPENEIIKYPDESMPMDFNQVDIFNKNNYINNNSNKNNLKERFINPRLNDVFFKIKKFEFKDNGKNNNINIYNKYLDNNKGIAYYYNNKENYREKILNNENINLHNRNYQNNLNDLKKNFLTYQINSKIKNDLDINENNKEITPLENNFVFTKENRELNENTWTYPSKYLLRPIFDLNSTNNFIKDFSIKRHNNKSNNNYYFNYNTYYANNQDIEAQNFFGIKPNENRLEQLLKSIPTHKNAQKNNYNGLLQLYKNKNNEKINDKNGINNNIFFKKRKSFSHEIHKIMPPNMIN